MLSPYLRHSFLAACLFLYLSLSLSIPLSSSLSLSLCLSLSPGSHYAGQAWLGLSVGAQSFRHFSHGCERAAPDSWVFSVSPGAKGWDKLAILSQVMLHFSFNGRKPVLEPISNTLEVLTILISVFFKCSFPWFQILYLHDICADLKKVFYIKQWYFSVEKRMVQPSDFPFFFI